MGDPCKNPGKLFREVYSTILLIFCAIVAHGVIFDAQNTKVARDVSPWLAFIVMWLALIWLSMVEGGQASLCGLPPVSMELYKDSHPVSHKIMSIANSGDNLDRYLMGRQFMVLALVFVENLCGDPSDKTTPILGMPSFVNKALLETGLAMFFMTTMMAKVSAQVNASRCMLDYVNNYFAYFTFQVARLIEVSGLLHCCYLAQIIFAQAAGEPIKSKRTFPEEIFFWGRVVVSLAILIFAFAVTLVALFNGQTTMWDGVPNWLAVILFFFFMAIVGALEGIQVAFFAVANMTDAQRRRGTWAEKCCDVLFTKNDGRNLPGFMVGRQMCVTLCFFIIARVTTIVLADGDDNIFGVPDGLQGFFNTGLLGALITTIVASIMWQLVATAFPFLFMNNPITYALLQWCLFLEWTGLCQGAWVMAMVLRKITHYKKDAVYLGTAEERVAKEKEIEAKTNKESSAETGVEANGRQVPQGSHDV